MNGADVINTHHRATGTGRNLGVGVIHRDEFQSGAGFIIGFHSFGKLPFKSIVHMAK